MSRKRIFQFIIGILAGIVIFCAANTAYHWHDTLPEDAQCFQLKMDDPDKLRAAVYTPSDHSVAIWKGKCETDILPKASQVNWYKIHYVQVGISAILVILLVLFVGFICLVIVFGPFIALYYWAFNPQYSDESYIQVFFDILRH